MPVALGDEEALVRSETSPKGLLQLLDLRSQLPSGQLSHLRSVRRTRNQGSLSICRPELPMMSVATEASFMLAPSSVFCSLLTSAERSCTRVLR